MTALVEETLARLSLFRERRDNTMPILRNHILYLSLDRGIKVGGTKGAAIHIAEFMEALYDSGYAGTLLAARRDKHSVAKVPYEIKLIPESRSQVPSERFTDVVPGAVASQELEEFYRNGDAETSVLDEWNSHGFDVIYERYSLFGVAGSLAARKLGVPHVLEVNAPLVLEASSHRNLTLVDLARSIEQALFSSADHIIAVSQGVRDYILSIVPKADVTVVPNGVNMRLFTGARTEGRMPDRERESMRIGFVGSVRPWHGVEILMDAFGLLACKRNDVTLVIVGEQGTMREHLERQIAEYGLASRVVFTGAVSHEQVPGLLSAMDVVVAPYPKLDNFYFSPLKVYEYMAAGRAIVASRIGQLTEVITDGHNGLLVEPGAAGPLAEAVERLLNDAALRERFGRQARTDAEQHHSWTRRMQDIMTIVDNARSKRSAGYRSNYADTV